MKQRVLAALWAPHYWLDRQEEPWRMMLILLLAIPAGIFPYLVAPKLAIILSIVYTAVVCVYRHAYMLANSD